MKNLLDRRLAPCVRVARAGRREFLRERLDCQSREQLVPRRLGGREQQAAEATRIVEPQASSGIEHEVDVIVRERRRARVNTRRLPDMPR